MAVVAVTVSHLAGGTSGAPCTVAAPLPSLPSQLAALGGFDQAYDANDAASLESLATQGAGVVAHNLIGATAGAPVHVAALEAAKPAAVVVPLLYPQTSTNSGRVAGLVDFLADCTGRVYFGSVDDLTAQIGNPPASFPRISESSAAAQLGTQSPQLVYMDTPFAPEWRNAATGAIIEWIAGDVIPPR